MQPDPSSPSRPSPAITAIIVMLAILLWIAVAVQLMFVVPLFEREFADFQLRVPYATEAAIAVSRWCVNYFYILPMPLAIIGVVVGASTGWVRHRLDRRVFAALWSALMLLLPVAVGFLVWLSCYLPHAKLLEALQGRGG